MAFFSSSAQVASVWTPPKNFHFPTVPNYLAATASGVSAVKPVVTSKVESFIAPIKYEATGVIATLEAASGVTLSSKGVGDMAALMKGASAVANNEFFKKTASSVLSLMDGKLGFATDMFKAVRQMQQVLTVAPIVGEVAQVILENVFLAIKGFGPTAEQIRECHAEAGRLTNNYCQRMLANAWIVPSGAGDKPLPMPADLFRHYLYGLRAPSIASMYVGLCGDQVPRNWGRTASRVFGKINPKTRQMMWKVIEGILMAVDDPLRPPTGKDGGRALYPILQGIVWNEWLNGTITADDIDGLAQNVCEQLTYRYKCDVTPDNAAGKRYLTIDKNCGRFIGASLRDSFFESLNQMKGKYYDPHKFKYDAVTKEWNLPDMPLASGKRPYEIVRVDPKISKALMASALPAIRPTFSSSSPPQTVAASLIAPALFVGGAGVAAYLVGKRKRNPVAS